MKFVSRILKFDIYYHYYILFPHGYPNRAMMKPDHAITKCESPTPRRFSRAFHPHLPRSSRGGDSLSPQPSPPQHSAQPGIPSAMKSSARHSPFVIRHFPRGVLCASVAKPAQRAAPKPSEGGSNPVKVSQTESNLARPTFGQPATWNPVLSYFKLI